MRRRTRAWRGAAARARALLDGRNVDINRVGRSYNRTVARVSLDGGDLASHSSRRRGALVAARRGQARLVRRGARSPARSPARRTARLTASLDQVRAFVTRLAPNPVCDGCIAERLDLATPQRANQRYPRARRQRRLRAPPRHLFAVLRRETGHPPARLNPANPARPRPRPSPSGRGLGRGRAAGFQGVGPTGPGGGTRRRPPPSPGLRREAVRLTVRAGIAKPTAACRGGGVRLVVATLPARRARPRRLGAGMGATVPTPPRSV